VPGAPGLDSIPINHKEVAMRSFYKLVAQVLMVCMVWTPFSIQAGMIGTDQVVASAQAQSDRDAVLNFVTRGDVVKQFEALGLSASTAKERVSAMTQDEISRIAGQIDSLPAGASSGGWLAAIVIIGLLVWLIWYKR
jgi:hypothetical protein